MSGGLRGYKELGLKYMPTKERYRLIGEIMRNNKIEESQIEFTLTEFNKYPANTSAYRLVRILSSGHLDCVPTLQRHFSRDLKPTHLMMFTPKDPSSLRVFINIPLDMPTEYKRLQDASAHTYPEVIASLTLKIEEDMKSKSAKQGWEILARARDRLKRYVDVPVYQAIVKYTNAANFGFSEADLKKCAANIVDSRMPAKLYFAETPAEIADMYLNASFGTCMAGDRDSVWTAMKKAQLHPCSIFGYHPHVRGCYIKSGSGTWRARAFLYKAEDGCEYYGRMYGNSGTDMTVLVNALKERGIKQLKDVGQGGNKRDASGYYYRSLEFKVPGFAYNGDYLLPVPYFDNFRGVPIVSFDEVTHEFTVKTCEWPIPKGWPGSNIPSYEVYNTGYISSRQLQETRPCNHCGRSIKPGSAYYELIDQKTGRQYCQAQCAANEGLVIAYTGENIKVLAPKIECVQDVYSQYYYTNVQAIISNGGAVLQLDPLVMEEEDELYTRQGNTDRLRKYMFSTSACSALFTKREISNTNLAFTSKMRITKRPRQIEFDPDTFSGITIKGEIRDVFENEVLDIDPNLGYVVAGPWPTTSNKSLDLAYDGLGDTYPARHDILLDQEAA